MRNVSIRSLFFFFSVVGIGTWSLSLASPLRAETRTSLPQIERPNILFIFSDDHAQAAISAYGSVVNETPGIDRLASRGARLLNSFVTNSICAPSRATLLTGQYSHMNGVPVFNRFDGSRDHLAKQLQSSGYHTGIVGKWHLGSDPTGFDRWIILPGQGAYFNPAWITPNGRLSIEGHCSSITTQLAIEFLESRPDDKPFFLMLHHKAPHRPWEPDEKNRELFANRSFEEPPTLFDDYATRPAALPANAQTIANDLTRRDLKLAPPPELTGQPRQAWLNVRPDSLDIDGVTLKGHELVRWKYNRYLQDYLACVQGVDDSVGEMLDYLDSKQLTDNTLVIYTSDNGWFLGEFGLYDKRFMYEPGLRTPLLASGPGVPAGNTPDAMVVNIDLAPTILDFAGVPAPESMQGKSFKQILQGKSSNDWRQSIYYRYYHSPGHHNTQAHYGVRTPTHKLIYYWNKDSYELFDLVNDPLEQNNLLHTDHAGQGDGEPTSATKQLFSELKQELTRLQGEYQDTGRYASPDEWPKDSVDAPYNHLPQLGRKSIAEAVELSQ